MTRNSTARDAPSPTGINVFALPNILRPAFRNRRRLLQTMPVESYRYCFSEREYLEQFPEERLRRRFMADPLWGKVGTIPI